MPLFPIDAIQLGASCAKVACESTWKWNTWNRPMKDFDLWYVWEGEGEVNLNGTTYSVSKGSCFLFRPGDRTIGSHNPSRPLTVTFIHFSLDPEIESLPPSYHVVRDTFIFENYLNQYVQSLSSQKAAFEEEAAALLKLLLLQLWRESLEGEEPDVMGNRPHLNIRGVANYIRQNPGKDHQIEELAERVQLSPRYFSLKFKQVIGKTVESFIIESRIERAEHLLRYNGMNVTEVAESLGYQNIYFFSKQFKKYRGISPSKARKS
jgi:AraC family transcriptional regulator of arabinose operon